jgi:hypothetical protein
VVRQAGGLYRGGQQEHGTIANSFFSPLYLSFVS